MSKRMTSREKIGDHTVVVVSGDDCYDLWSVPKKFSGAAIERLAAYEDAMPVERAHELAEANLQGRLMVLPPNDPLTTKELVNMSGQPVYYPPKQRWMLVDFITITAVEGGAKVYRYPPKEEK